VATDLLLGTQGWRRFKYFETEEQLKNFIQNNKDKVHIERLGLYRLLSQIVFNVKCLLSISISLPMD
jgi:hypothetical protein